MIDEKKLIEDIDNCVAGLTNIQMIQIVDIIEKQPKLNEWIPCSERLPKPIDGEVSVEVEVTVQGFERNITGRAFYFFGLGKFYPPSLGRGEIKNVIAWMPLPAPYDMRKKVRNENGIGLNNNCSNYTCSIHN